MRKIQDQKIHTKYILDLIGCVAFGGNLGDYWLRQPCTIGRKRARWVKPLAI